MKTPRHLTKLIDSLKKLPGVGSRSAERFAYRIIEWSPEALQEFSQVLSEVPLRLKGCDECGALMEDSCSLCEDGRRDNSILCVVASSKEIYSIESTREFRGHYHVLGGLLSPLDQICPKKLSIPKLKERIRKFGTQELLLALDSTLEGDTTALYLKQELADLPIKISRLAFGLPMGSSLDYVDGGTLARALMSRSEY